MNALAWDIPNGFASFRDTQHFLDYLQIAHVGSETTNVLGNYNIVISEHSFSPEQQFEFIMEPKPTDAELFPNTLNYLQWKEIRKMFVNSAAASFEKEVFYYYENDKIYRLKESNELKDKFYEAILA